MNVLPISLRHFTIKFLLNPVGWICWFVIAIFLVLDFQYLSVFSFFILLVSCFNFLPYYLIKNAESKFHVPEDNFGNIPTHILVLGGGHIPSSEIIIEQQLSSNSLRRVLEGVRLYNKNNALLIMCGKSLKPGHPSQAEIQSHVAMTMGVEKESIKTISEPSNTEEEALFYFRDFSFHKKPIFLVTKAIHLKRASFIFSSFGHTIIPAPSYFIYKNYQPTLGWFLIPDFSLISCFGEYLKEIAAFNFLKIKCFFNLKDFPSKTDKAFRRTSFEVINR